MSCVVFDFWRGPMGDVSVIPLRPVLAAWLGWLVDAGRPIVAPREVTSSPVTDEWADATGRILELGG